MFLLFLFAVLSASITSYEQCLLDDAVRDAARQIQIDTQASAGASGFVRAVCDEFGLVGANCSSALTYSVQAASAGFSSITPAKLDATGALPDSFFAGTGFAPGVAVLVQVAYKLPVNFPFIGSLATGTGTGAILSTTAIEVEPFR